jgi:hypothetical protein
MSWAQDIYDVATLSIMIMVFALVAATTWTVFFDRRESPAEDDGDV